MSDRTKELAEQLHSGQARYTYFLLAAAASGIALSVQRTTDMSLQCSRGRGRCLTFNILARWVQPADRPTVKCHQQTTLYGPDRLLE